MNNRDTRARWSVPALAGAALMTLALAAPTLAQAPNGGNGGAGGGFGGRRGGNNARGPRAGRPTFGTVSSVDPAAGTITVTPSFGGNGPQVVQVGSAQMVTQADVTVADLKVGDQVQVQGLPLVMTAAQITAGTAPAGLPGAGGRAFGRGPAAGGAAGATTRTGNGNTYPAMAVASGRILSLNPLTVNLAPDVNVQLNIRPDTKVSRIGPIQLSAIKPGDRLLVTGQTGADGTLTASTVAVNFGNAAGGGRFGGGGFGGGGFGGGRRQRGGANGQGGGGNFPGGGAQAPGAGQ